MNIPNVINKYIYIYMFTYLHPHREREIYIYIYTCIHACMHAHMSPAELGAPAWPCSTSALLWFCAQISTNAWIPVSSAWQRLTGDQLSLTRCHTSWSKWTSTLKNQRFACFSNPQMDQMGCVLSFFYCFFPILRYRNVAKITSCGVQRSLDPLPRDASQRAGVRATAPRAAGASASTPGGIGQGKHLGFSTCFPNSWVKMVKKPLGKHDM